MTDEPRDIIPCVETFGPRFQRAVPVEPDCPDPVTFVVPEGVSLTAGDKVTLSTNGLGEWYVIAVNDDCE